MSKLDALIKETVKDLGEYSAGYGITEVIGDKIPFSSPRLNYMTYGGLPAGRIHEFSGPEGSRQDDYGTRYNEKCAN